MTVKNLKFILAGLLSATLCGLIFSYPLMFYFEGMVLGIALYFTFTESRSLKAENTGSLFWSILFCGFGWVAAFYSIRIPDYFFQGSPLYHESYYPLITLLNTTLSGFLAGLVGGISVWLSYFFIKFKPDGELNIKAYRSVILVGGIMGSICFVSHSFWKLPFESLKLSMALHYFIPWQVATFYWLGRFESA